MHTDFDKIRDGLAALDAERDRVTDKMIPLWDEALAATPQTIADATAMLGVIRSLTPYVGAQHDVGEATDRVLDFLDKLPSFIKNKRP